MDRHTKCNNNLIQRQKKEALAYFIELHHWTRVCVTRRKTKAHYAPFTILKCVEVPHKMVMDNDEVQVKGVLSEDESR